ncbi:MAG TPA: hypothetical protein VK804_00315 [Bradyrhizobium sp.]|jgi:hypothetical protein|nr:hypothetical protein [Bradyrhizobium sp.]HTA98893.1 hypothetical protein [Bradyrhizobium sp.]
MIGGAFIMAFVQFLRRILAVTRLSNNRYRPERHYMRGPGPKSRARSARNGEGMEAAQRLEGG